MALRLNLLLLTISLLISFINCEYVYQKKVWRLPSTDYGVNMYTLAIDGTMYICGGKSSDTYTFYDCEDSYGRRYSWNGRINAVINSLDKNVLNYGQMRWVSTPNGCYRHSNSRSGTDYAHKGSVNGKWNTIAYANGRCLTEFGWCSC